MLAKLNTFALVGIDTISVEVEVDAPAGPPKTILVTLPEMAFKESIHRIERSMANLGYQRHAGRLVINLAPGDLKKEATAFDLLIALSMLVGSPASCCPSNTRTWRWSASWRSTAICGRSKAPCH